jgi:hypothetical protein
MTAKAELARELIEVIAKRYELIEAQKEELLALH